ncbi:hypothetical protein BRE01_63170 [Brevibacillus reuszeri]|uniref:HTH merR-type domain-containing protein n=1 Tax=Brevibacillus reuszeri TaxID=54915 RepID=A0A0K9YQ99_9BACL|nr:MerR family transcriptional regulator [Brevibacillus reuszeri]KNB70345.1 hypothetical protein ADS79_15435 [Brevibacillus reuszeri]MED1859317.1 MerR family transcriptional regulator [Brevibacillus reuszeri]GED72615.1 hypothetical protein BRE01_63170 [Brevibacillus reuszeri]
MGDQPLTIQQAAVRTGLSVHTLRYYEKIGLMEPVARGENGHRSYHTHNLEWIELIARLRNTGMPIADMQRFADLMRQGNDGIGQRRQLLQEHEQTLLAQVKDLQDTLRVLRGKIEYYQAWEARHSKETKQNTE